MDQQEFEIKLAELDSKIEAVPNDAALLMERGKLYQKAGVNDKALNDYVKVQTLDPSNLEAREHIKMLREIFAFRYMNYYNP